jgi:hypothetical protein
MRTFVGTDELKGARFEQCDLGGASFRGVNLAGMVVTDAWLHDADISGDIRGMRINGVDVAPLVEAELDRLHPERTRLRPSDIPGLREALDVVDAMWVPTLERARSLPPHLLHERVDDEFSFVETQRHLLFAVDAWLVRMVLRVPMAYHQWAVPPDLPTDAPPDSGPELDDVMAVRAERSTRLRAWIDEASEADLDAVVSPPDPTGHPQGEFKVRSCFQVVLNEEWWHHRYATRDLAILEARTDV